MLRKCMECKRLLWPPLKRPYWKWRTVTHGLCWECYVFEVEKLQAGQNREGGEQDDTD